jgi:3-methyladenine DNA glycosylase AlkD
MTTEQIIADLKLHANAQAVEGMARFGIRPAQALGVSIPTLRKMAKDALKELQAKKIKD